MQDLSNNYPFIRPFGGKNWSFGASDHYLHFPPMLPKPNEFLHWAVAKDLMNLLRMKTLRNGWKRRRLREG